MILMKKLSVFLFFVLIVVMCCKPVKPLNIFDGFESDTLSKIWTADKLLPGALSFQSRYVRSGNKAAMITLHKGDQIEAERGTELERAELKELRKLFTPENESCSYSFSIFLPPDFPIVPTRLVIAQWKQDCKGDNCDPDNPVVTLRYRSGEFYITLQTDRNQSILYSQKEGIIGQWLDFKFNIRFSRKDDGGIKAWLNSNQIIDYKGVTAYSEKYGYLYPGVFYFKTGLYRDQMEQPMTICIDNYMKQHIPAL
jgi:hypothetical protein